MKKVLLSLAVIAAVMTANAQNVGVGAEDNFPTTAEIGGPMVGTQTSGIYWWSDAVNASFYPGFNDLITPADATSGLKRRQGGVLTVNVNKTGVTTTSDSKGYSPFGFGFGDDNGPATGGNPFYINISGKKTLTVTFKSSVAATSMRFQVIDAAGNTLDTKSDQTTNYSATATAANTLYTTTIDLTNGYYQDYSTGSLVIKNTFDFSQLAKVSFFPAPGSNFTGTITITDVKVGTVNYVGLGTRASAAANIASTKVFPNPATSDFTAEIVLKNNASVNVILSDMTGRQIATKAVDANGDANFQTAGLVAGMYTVTYVIDGTPAKTELVVVK
jgi:hypothetical protein